MAAENDNVYVTGLPSDIDDQSLKKVFGAYGSVVRCKILPPTSQGQGKGAALLQYFSVSEAAWVVLNLNGNVPQGLTEPVLVKFANKPAKGADAHSKDAGGYGPSKGASSGSRHSPYNDGNTSTQPAASDNLYVTGLPPNLDNDLLHQFFSAYGKVAQCKVLPPRPDATSSVALVRFATAAEAEMVKSSLDGTVPPGRTEHIRVRYATKKDTSDLHQLPMLPPMTGDCKGKSKGKFSIKSLLAGFESSFASSQSLGTNEDKAVYIAGLPADCDDYHLYQLFAPFGPIAPKGVRPMKNPDGSCKGFGFVNFMLAESAHAAIGTFNGCELPDGTLMKASVKRQGGGAGKGAAHLQPQVIAPTFVEGQPGQPATMDEIELANLDMGGSYGFG